MQTLSNIFYKRLGVWHVVIGAALFIGFNILVILPFKNGLDKLAGKEIKILDLTYPSTPQRIIKVMADYNQEIVQRLKHFALFHDTVYPVIHTFLFISLLTVLLRRLPEDNKWRLLNLLPILIGIIDLVENQFIVQVLNTGVNAPLPLLYSLSFFTTLKWSLIGVCAITAVVLLLRPVLIKREPHI